MEILTIYKNLLIFLVYKNINIPSQSIIIILNLIFHLFYIFVKPFLMTCILLYKHFNNRLFNKTTRSNFELGTSKVSKRFFFNYLQYYIKGYLYLSGYYLDILFNITFVLKTKNFFLHTLLFI